MVWHMKYDNKNKRNVECIYFLRVICWVLTSFVILSKVQQTKTLNTTRVHI